MTPEQPAPLRFFEGFAWPVPTAFAGALGAFRFEQGDVFFREASAYEAVSGADEAGNVALQVLLPKRSGRATPADAEGDRRSLLWEAPVVLERVDLARGQSETITTSQGRLFMTLWVGDERWLDPSTDSPPVPLAARDLASRIEEARGTFEKRWRRRSGVAFLFVVDLASDASRSKAATIEAALAPLGRPTRVALAPERAGVSDPEQFHPALEVRGIAITGVSAEAAESALRGALYGGANASDGDGAESRPDRFSVARHGMLFPLGGGA